MNLTFVKTGKIHNHFIFKMYVDNCFECFALISKDNMPRSNRRYRVRIDDKVSEHQHYKKHSDKGIRNMHKGMLTFSDFSKVKYVLAVFPGFSEIEHHHIYLVSNVYEDIRKTAIHHVVERSVPAYTYFYAKAIAKLSSGESINIHYFTI